VASSVLLFLCELFLLEGVPDVSGEDSALVDFSAPADFFELFVLELDGLPVVSAADPVLALAPRVALLGDALALAAAEAVADAAALGEALAVGDALIPTDALGEA
jgi:hypothetical protein